MKLSDFIIEELKKMLEESLFEKYEDTKDFFTDVCFEEFLVEIIFEVEKEVKSLLEVTNDTVGVIARRIQKTKQRWYNKEMMENEAFSEEIRIAKELYKSLEISNQLKKFKYVYNGFDNCTELENSIIKELSEWYKNEDSLLTDFRYLKAKRPYQIKKAFINDALYLSYSFLRDKYPYGEKSVVVGAPDVIGLIPIDHTNRVKISVDNIVKKESKAYFFNKYVVDNDFAVESLMDVDILKKGVMVETLKILGWNDMDIFFILLSKRDDDFFITREIITDVGSIVKEKYSSRSEQNYQSVRESLWRMEFLSTGVITPSLTGFSFRLLDDVEIGTFKKDGTIEDKNRVKVIVNNNVVNDYFMDRTVKLYKDVIDKVESDASKVLLFRLQKERVRCSMEGTDIFDTNMNFFRRTLYFSNKRRNENIKMVEKALNEIVSHNIMLKSYKRNKDMFRLEFYPMTEREKRDLIGEEANRDYLNGFNQLIGKQDVEILE